MPLIPIWDERTFYGFVADSEAFRRPASPPRDLRPGRLRHRRLGHRLPQLHAGDPARRLHRPRTATSGVVGGVEQLPRRLWKMRPRDGASGRAAPRSTRSTAAARDRASPASPAARRGRPLRRHRPLGRHPQLRRRRRHLPDLAALHQHRHRGAPVPAEDLDGHGPHPLHAVLQDLRDGRPPLLERPRSQDRPLRHEPDAHRPPAPAAPISSTTARTSRPSSASPTPGWATP